ncbi:MAG: PAS domain-containing protein, partial [Gammaproteobacteria bacterium]|nr:PAS domain-containing protein [Gammaproteobacteria bacterium]
MLYIDKQIMLSSFIEHFSNFDFELSLLDINLSDTDVSEPLTTQNNDQVVMPTTVTFSEHRVFKVANRDLLLKITSKYHPGILQMIIALAVMVLIAVALRVWGVSRMHQRQAIAKQEETFQALFTERERAEVTLSSITDAVLTTDDNDKITFLNPVAEKLMGISNDEAFGKTINDVVHLLDE